MTRLLDPKFKWIPSASHDADSTLFRERQRQRMREAEERRKAEAKQSVVQLKRERK